jgi:hypothetical protein
MTAADPLDPQPAAAEHTELADCFGGVLRAGGPVPTIGAEVGTYQFLVNPDQTDR